MLKKVLTVAVLGLSCVSAQGSQLSLSGIQKHESSANIQSVLENMPLVQYNQRIDNKQQRKDTFCTSIYLGTRCGIHRWNDTVLFGKIQQHLRCGTRYGRGIDSDSSRIPDPNDFFTQKKHLLRCFYFLSFIPLN